MACLVTVLFLVWKTLHKNLLGVYYISAFLFIVIFTYIFIQIYLYNICNIYIYNIYNIYNIYTIYIQYIYNIYTIYIYNIYTIYIQYIQYLYNIYKYIYISYISYYPEKRYWNACFIAGTRICSCTNIKEHLPKHIYKFGRHLRIRYYNQPTQTKEIQQETELQDNNNTSDIEEQLPLNLTYTQEIPTNNTQQDINSQQTSKDEQQIPEEEYHTSEEE